MRTDILKIDTDFPEPDKVERAAELLQGGGIVAIPTETVYGLAADADNINALQRLYAIKNRPTDKPFTIQIAGFSQLEEYVDRLPTELETILREFWPGALTVIISSKRGKVGLRMPDNKVALSVIEKTKAVLAVTSANISGERPAFTAGEVMQIFNGRIDLVVDDGKRAEGVESTVLDCTVSPFKIVRRGLIADKLHDKLYI